MSDIDVLTGSTPNLPPRYCPLHPAGTSARCSGCAAARHEYDEALIRTVDAVAVLAPEPEAPKPTARDRAPRRPIGSLVTASRSLSRLGDALLRLESAERRADVKLERIYRDEVGLFADRAAEAVEGVLGLDLFAGLRQLAEQARPAPGVPPFPGEVDHSLRESGSASSAPSSDEAAES